ncbi:maestro heat-like repeat-containing protein family member 6 [Amia ocellicauda]|uniref:maestro heat-like repeat-containing protein family member 6 n=1 Tax=Amia ocellicauda TaxID=2972642 RepID=UPI003463CA3A
MHLLQEGLVRLLLHLRDPSPEMTEASLLSLIHSGLVLRLNTTEHSEGEGELGDDDFLDNCAAYLVSDFPETLGRSFSCSVDCLRSPFPGVGASAAISIGFLIRDTPETLCPGCKQMDEILRGLMRNLQVETDAEAESCAVEAMGHWSDSQQKGKEKRPWWKRSPCCHP